PGERLVPSQEATSSAMTRNPSVRKLVAALLAGAIRMSHRRGAFVSAVTHELRTPLTTFRLYADMLAEGMVTDEDKRADYLSRLRDEADRLSHLVENVLAYARLSRAQSAGRREDLTLGDLIGRVRGRLAARAARDGMHAVFEPPDDGADAAVRVQVSVIEQILLNLVDNACKYAADGRDKTIAITTGVDDGLGLIRVRDHGPGIPAHRARRLFRAFTKSATEAANSAPGIGLGLALSRRLARDMGGDLRLDESISDGACFVLSAPMASGQEA
ncbi:hypothetical protein LCGC14_3090950, partial [marine sediment metagenome]